MHRDKWCSLDPKFGCAARIAKGEDPHARPQGISDADVARSDRAEGGSPHFTPTSWEPGSWTALVQPTTKGKGKGGGKGASKGGKGGKEGGKGGKGKGKSKGRGISKRSFQRQS